MTITKPTGYPVIDEIIEMVATDNRAEVEHTATPYEYVHYSGRSKGFGINNLPPVSHQWQRVADIGYRDNDEREIAEANAAFIVKACNSHDENQRRIAELEATIKSALDKVFNSGRRDEWVEIQQSAINELRAVLNRARQSK